MKNKKKQTKRSSPLKTKRSLIWIGSIIVLAIAATFIYMNAYPPIYNNIRKDRIEKIYSSLNLNDEEYILQEESVFGEKRTYEWDKGRSYSSSKQYLRAADVRTTVAELRKAIESAGFKFIGEPYPGSMQTQYHFRSGNNEYIRMTVSGKPRDDAFQNRILMHKELDESVFKIDPNEGPSNVIIKVNLDDNNE